MMEEKTKEADVQEGQIVMVMKDNPLPDTHPALVLDPRHLIDAGILYSDESEKLVIQVNHKHFTQFADAALAKNLRLIRLREEKKYILFRLELGRISLETMH